MRLGRTLPPAAAPIGVTDLLSGVRGIFRGQKEIDRFRSELKAHFGVKHCYLVSSGKAALTLILLALKTLIPGRDRVLIPAYTCFSVPSSVVRAGVEISLCDLHPDNFDFDFPQLAAILYGSSSSRADAGSAGSRGGLIDRILAVVPTHLFGIPADVARLRKLIRDPGVTIVEDAAQAMGETSQEGMKAGTLGDVSFFSLGRGKALSLVEGGVILTDRDDLAEGLGRLVNGLPRYGFVPLLGLLLKAAALMTFIRPRLFWLPKAIPFLKLGETLFEPHFPMRRMSPFQAGLARNWKGRLEMLRDVRKRNVSRWIVGFEGSNVHGLHHLARQSLGLVRFPLRVSDSHKRDSLLRESARMGAGIMPVYPTSIDAIPELAGRIEAGSFPVAERVARELVTLPTHEFVTEDDAAKLRRLVFSVVG